MNELQTNKIEAFRTFIAAHNLFFIAGHKEPDGDCVACSLGLKAIIEHFGKKALLVNAGPFLKSEIAPYENQFTSTLPFMTVADKSEAALVLCDCSELSRIGELPNGGEEELKGLDTFIVDHHCSCQALGEAGNAIIDGSAPAASLIVQLLFEALVGEVPKPVAEVLYFGVMTDTGFFRFLTERDADVFLTVARLVKAGASPRLTYDKIASGKPFEQRKLLGLILTNAKQYLGGKLIIATEQTSDTLLHGRDGRDSDALYSALMSTKDVEAVVFIRQETETNCTLGFRSRNAVDVSAVAAQFNGGGHKNAAGGHAQGTLDTVIPVVVKAFAKVMG